MKDPIQYRSQSLLNLARGYFSERSIVIKLPAKRALLFSVYNWQAVSCEYKQYCDVVLPNVLRPEKMEFGLKKI